MGVTMLKDAVFILWMRGVTTGLDYPLLLDKAVTALSGGRLLTFLYPALSFVLFLNLIYLVIFITLLLLKSINVV
jgi:hypothetical protein